MRRKKIWTLAFTNMAVLIAVLSGLVLAGVTPALGTTWTVHPAGVAVSGANQIAGLSKINWSLIKPGDEIILKGSEGTYKESFNITVQGSESAPITIRGADGESPVIEGPVVISGSSYVEIKGLTVTKSPYAGVIISNGSHHITVRNCTVYGNALGIWIGDNAGMQNVITNNTVYNNSTHGIAVDRVNCAAGKETVISGNKVYGNGHHGIEIYASYYIIEGNEVFENGAASQGTSGIHIYSAGPQENTGDYNIIRYNISYRNKESNGPDGNGIQLDQWCDYNQVYYNICFENDGAGISVYDSANSLIYNNTLIGNMVDPGKSHPFKAELYLASDPNVNWVKNVTVANNILYATRASVPPIAVYAPVTNQPLSIGNNLLFHKAGDILFYWGGQTGKDIATWNKLASGGGDDIAGDPQFQSLAGTAPASPADVALKPSSPGLDKGINVGQNRDILGNPVPSGNGIDLGAVESAASSAAPTIPAPTNLRVVN